MRRQTQRVKGEKCMDDVCPSEDLRCCVYKTEKDPFDDVWAYAVNRLVDLLRQFFC